MTTCVRGMVLCVLLAMMTDCGDKEEGIPALPQGFNPDTVTGSKTDLITKWLTEEKGPLAVDKQVSGKTSTYEWFHGYTLKLTAKDKLSFVGDGDYWGMLRIYGPQKTGGSWGYARAAAYIRPQGEEYVAELPFTVPEDGEYLAVIGSPWVGNYAYTLGSTCLSGSCKAKPHCLEYETTDAQGKPLQNFYAINVSSYAEGKQILAKMTNFINEAILPGTCASQSTGCPKVYLPVCGDSPGYPKKTYGNVCNFKAEIRTLAGATSEAKGHWEDGVCKASHCTIWEGANPDGTASHTFYAVNVFSYDEGKQLLAKVKYFLNEDILTGSCGSQLEVCPKVYKPICADTPTTSPKTFGNLCEFRFYVMNLAGDTGEHKGKWTDGVCPCDPAKEWWRKYVSTDVEECKVLKYYCQPYTWYFSNACGCGCEQSDECPEWINCMPPAPQSCTDLKKKCPYSKVAY
jgi:hypothetical protein